MNGQEDALQVSEVLGDRYRIVSAGISGDIGTSYRAYDMQGDSLVAVLLLDRRFGSETRVLERLAESRRRVARLAQPALIPVEDAGTTRGQLYLIYRAIEGRTLADLLSHAGHLGSEAAVQIAVGLCEALGPAHQAGLAHGGLSPHCVIVGQGGQIAVRDTGILPALRPVPAPAGQPWGRFPYLAPEQAAGGEIHPTSDVYAIGLLLYEMLAGRLPFYAGNEIQLAWQHLHQTPAPLQSLVPHIPPHLAQIVHKALAKEPAARYRNAGQVAHILRSQWAADVGAPAAPQYAPLAERLVVPPPPAEPASQVPYGGPGTDRWIEEPAGIDWLMIVLAMAALLAVLGLIPLWRTVYRRYAVPPIEPTPVSCYPSRESAQAVLLCLAGQQQECEEAGMPAGMDGYRMRRHHNYAQPAKGPAMSGKGQPRFRSLAYGFRDRL